MPSPAPDQLAKLRSETLAAGATFIDDLQHLRTMLAAKAPAPDDIRRASLALRRLLVDGELRKLGAPRLGRMHLDVPDNNPIYKAAAKEPFLFFMSGGISVEGAAVRALTATRGRARRVLVKDFDPDRMTSIGLDGFLAQRVLCLDGPWVTREMLIRHAADIASGVYTGKTGSPQEAVMSRIREVVSLGVDGDTVVVHLNVEADRKFLTDFAYDPTALDPVLVELLAACRFLTDSGDVKCLEASLPAELKSR